MYRPLVLALAGLFLAGPAQAQNAVVVDLIPSFSPEPIHVHFDIQDAQELADWVMWLSALDGPGSGGPSDIPADIQILQQAQPGDVLHLSDDLFWLSDPSWSDPVLTLLQEQPLTLVEPLIGDSLGQSLGYGGAPGHVQWGIQVELSTSLMADISNGI